MDLFKGKENASDKEVKHTKKLPGKTDSKVQCERLSHDPVLPWELIPEVSCYETHHVAGGNQKQTHDMHPVAFGDLHKSRCEALDDACAPHSKVFCYYHRMTLCNKSVVPCKSIQTLQTFSNVARLTIIEIFWLNILNERHWRIFALFV